MEKENTIEKQAKQNVPTEVDTKPDFHLDQKKIDGYKNRIFEVWAQSTMQRGCTFLPKRHLWFDEKGELKVGIGEAPPNDKRPEHLKGLDLNFGGMRLSGTSQKKMEDGEKIYSMESIQTKGKKLKGTGAAKMKQAKRRMKKARIQIKKEKV